MEAGDRQAIESLGTDHVVSTKISGIRKRVGWVYFLCKDDKSGMATTAA